MPPPRSSSPSRFRVRDLGREVPYGEGMEVMRTEGTRVDDEGPVLLLLEHAPTITVTRTGGRAHVLMGDEGLADEGIALVETDRGGDVTFHGPGQLVGYPVVKLPWTDGHLDLVGYIRALEAGLVDAVAALGVRGAHVKPGMTGVWVASDPDAPSASWVDDDNARKIVAIGVGVGKGGITRHGFALNVDIDLEPYLRAIVPCGLAGRPVTTLVRELGDGAPSSATVRSVVASHVVARLDLFLAANQNISRSRDLPQSAASAVGHDGAIHG